MANKQEFKQKLDGILKKYTQAIESKDDSFVSNYMVQCLDREVVLSPRSFKPHKKTCGQCVGDILIKVLLLSFLFAGIAIYTKSRLETEPGNVYAKDANYWAYTIRRWVVRLGINNFVTFQKYYDSDCLIKNPMAPKEKKSCFCGFTLKKYDVKNSTEALRKAFKNKLRSGNLNPFIIKNFLEYPVSYADVRSVVMSATQDFDSGHSFVNVLSGKRVGSDYKAIFADPEASPPESNVAWSMNFVAPAHHLRTLFPRPSFISPEQEVHLYRALFFYGANAPNTSVSLKDEVSTSAGSFYIQAWGSRLMALVSHAECGCKNSVLAFSLNQGDLLYYSAEHHNLNSAARKTEKGPSMGYHSSVSTDIAKEV